MSKKGSKANNICSKQGFSKEFQYDLDLKSRNMVHDQCKHTIESFLWVKYKIDWANRGEYMVGTSTTCKSAIVRP